MLPDRPEYRDILGHLVQAVRLDRAVNLEFPGPAVSQGSRDILVSREHLVLLESAGNLGRLVPVEPLANLVHRACRDSVELLASLVRLDILERAGHLVHLGPVVFPEPPGSLDLAGPLASLVIPA